MTRQMTLLAALGAVLVIALWWLFLYSPGQEELAAVEEDVAAAEAEAASLQQRVAALEAVRARAPETEAAIAQLLSIVPDDPALPAALRQITAAAEDAGVSIEALATARPSVTDEALGLYNAAISMTATGSYFQLVDLLRRLEDPAITARGFIFDNLAIVPSEYPELNVTLTGRMFAQLDPVPVPEPDAATGPTGNATEAPTEQTTPTEEAA